MTVQQLTDFLIAECEDANNTTFATSMLTQAKTALLAGSGTVAALTMGSLNGKSITREVKLSPAEVALACRNAIRSFNNEAGSGSITFLDFSKA